jgi:hypothetical protein
MFLLAESYVGMGPVSFSAISAAVLRELSGKDLTAGFAEKIPRERKEKRKVHPPSRRSLAAIHTSDRTHPGGRNEEGNPQSCGPPSVSCTGANSGTAGHGGAVDMR